MKTNNQIEVYFFFMRTFEGPRFLLLHRIPERGGFWQPVTGGVEEGESFEDAVFREGKEETGITSIQRLVSTNYSFQFFDSGRQQTEFVYGAEVPPDVEAHLSQEHDAFRWVTFDGALSLLKWEGNREGLRRLSAALGT